MWKYPEPDSQWNPNAQIWVKVADYGISKQVSPQGLRGESGTRPYLPPEVLLYGGKEAYSTKIDIYAFGMFIYYLMTYLSPFQLQDRPLTVLLAEGRRPQLPSKVPAAIIFFTTSRVLLQVFVVGGRGELGGIKMQPTSLKIEGNCSLNPLILNCLK